MNIDSFHHDDLRNSPKKPGTDLCVLFVGEFGSQSMASTGLDGLYAIHFPGNPIYFDPTSNLDGGLQFDSISDGQTPMWVVRRVWYTELLSGRFRVTFSTSSL